MKIAKGLLSVVGLGGGAPKAAAAPVQATAAVADVKGDAESAAKKARATLYETAGGASGQELTSSQVKKRDTLFGN